MNIVLFTSHYPYVGGEPFLYEEMNVLSREFENIKIVSYQKDDFTTNVQLPHNVSVVPVRKNVGTFEKIYAGIYSLCNGSIGEIFKGLKERGIRNLKEVAIKVISTDIAFYLYKKEEISWITVDTDTVYYAYWLSAEAVYLARAKKYLCGACVSRAHGSDCFYDREYHPYRKEQLEQLDYIFPVSEAGKVDLINQIKKYNIDYSHIKHLFVSRLGVRKNSVNLNPWARNEDFVIVTCSRIIPLKRLDLVIKALSMINGKSIEWIHFGDGESRNDMEAMSRNILGSKHNIKYEFMGNVDNSEILHYYESNKIDLFINSSDSEGIPVSIMEAMSFGIPCIARDVGGNSEIVENMCNGILLGSNVNAVNLAEAINQIIQMPKCQYIDMRKAAKRTYEQKYSINNYKLFIDFIKSIH